MSFQFVSSRNAATVNSPERQPWEYGPDGSGEPQRGGRRRGLELLSLRWGFGCVTLIEVPGLTPWAIDCRPFGTTGFAAL